ncbi:MAG: hypothetical protein EB084_26370, partial [Proteobacteria bacterium]|nr:hypothetical protein [Pseudomonadota bacterium]
MAGARQLVPAHARLIEWGHRISFAYIAGSRLHDDALLEPLASDICLYDQQACSSPQCVYLETAEPAVLEGFAERLAAVLDRVSRTRPGARPTQVEWAEITTVTELARLDACLERTRVIEAPDRSWRVLVDQRSSLQASPLYRSVWVKPLPRADIIGTLRPLRQYLQTVALAADLADTQPLSTALFAAGAQRITDVGHMLDSYVGEPHDGLYALQRYTRRVSVQAGEALRGFSSFGELTEPFTPPRTRVPVMGKAEFQAAHVDERHADLYFKSGGSSGQPKISIFTYHDYHEQMRGAAEGLYAAGLDPSVDRCINLFFGGEMYGGFISFFSVLEIMGAVQ